MEICWRQVNIENGEKLENGPINMVIDYMKRRNLKKTSVTKSYHSNGRLSAIGMSRTNITDQYRNWYKYGVWKYYDESGKLAKEIDFSRLLKETTKEVDQAGNKELQDNMKKINKALNGGSN